MTVDRPEESWREVPKTDACSLFEERLVQRLEGAGEWDEFLTVAGLCRSTANAPHRPGLITSMRKCVIGTLAGRRARPMFL